MSRFLKFGSMGLGVLLVIGLVGFLAIQLVPVRGTNPPVVSEPSWDSAQTRALMERACFDCHSNETKWPWYTRVAPVSWLAVHDVNEGRAKLNYSQWRPSREDESIETIVEGSMPPRAYLLMHPEARLSAAETQQLIAGLRATLQNSGGAAARQDDDD